MPKVKNVATGKPTKKTKPKLSPEERSQVAKDRWAKRKAQETQQNVSSVSDKLPAALDTLLDEAVANAPEGADRVDLLTKQGTILATRDIQPPVEVPAPHEVNMIEMALRGAKERDDELVFSMRSATPAPQLSPVASKKPKRAHQPKEFSSALKEAEKRLGKAINERAEAMAKLAFLQSEIPNLMGIIQALKGSGNYVPPVTYDFAVGGQAHQVPAPQYPSPLDAIQNAQPSIPVSRAQGGAVQFGPDVLGSLEGPDDDDDNPDKYITGPLAGGGWK